MTGFKQRKPVCTGNGLKKIFFLDFFNNIFSILSEEMN